MPEYQLYCFAQSGNAYRAALMLNLIGADWKPVYVDFFKGGETRTPKYRSEVNEMGEVPVLCHGDKKLTQSGVILTYLSRHTGKFAPEGEDEELEVLRWILFDNHKFTSYFATHRFMLSLAGKPADPHVLSFLRGRVEAALAVADKHFADRAFVIGERPTIADLSLAGYMFYPNAETGFDLKAYPAIDGWRGRLAAMKGFKPPYEMMPVGSDLRIQKP